MTRSLSEDVAFGHRFSRHAMLLCYMVLFLALTFPFWLRGDVVAPFRLTNEIGAPEATTSPYIENRKFSDYWLGYVSEVSLQIKAPRSGWLALWDSENELGRPLFHLAGFSPAYAPTWLILKITSDPRRLITLLSLSNCFLAGLFVMLLCRELLLEPLAGLLAGASTAASPLFMYWLTFPMFTAGLCWSAGILYASTRLAKRPDLLGCGVLAFSTYSLLMTGYPQMTVYSAYIATGYLLHLAYCRWRSTDLRSSAQYLAIVAIPVGIGGLLTLPVYLDLARTASQSARIAPDISFFTAVLPKVYSLITAVRFLVLSTFPETLGNPISPTFPFSYNGLSITPLILFFALVGLLYCLRETWGWWLAIVILLALTFIQPAYAFGVKHMGLNLSRSIPIGAAPLPIILIAAYGVNSLIRQPRQRTTAVILAGILTLGCLLVAVVFGLASGLGIRWHVVLSTLLVLGFIAANVRSIRPALLIGALIVTGAFFSFPLMLRQPASQMTEQTPLLKKVIGNVPPDSRFAIVGPGISLLQPNLNAIFGVASLHSYDSLSSRRYQRLIVELGGKTQTYGRLNVMIAPDYGSEAFWMSDIGLVLSPTKLKQPNLEDLGEQGGIHLYRVASRMGCCLQVTSPFRTTEGGVELVDWKAIDSYRPLKIKDEGDLKEFKVQGDRSSLLILSQQYHPDWRAFVRVGASRWAPARTVAVHGAFQGVILPAGSQMVQLKFLPFARFAFVGHIFWLVAFIVIAARSLQTSLSHRESKRVL